MSEIRDDRLVRKTLIEDKISHKIIHSDLVITKEEFLACYNEWVLKPMLENPISVQSEFCVPVDNNGVTPV